MTKTLSIPKILMGIFLVGFPALAEASWSPADVAELSELKCSQVPHSAALKLPISTKYPETFDLFYFTAKKINPALPWVLFMDGGPGVVKTEVPKSLAAGFSDVNFVVFHMRGAGCSRLPLAAKYDADISTALSVSDADQLREKLGIKEWFAVFGTSYGTLAARNYAAHFPERVRMLLLQGLVGAERSDKGIQNRGRAQVVAAWMDKNQQALQGLIGTVAYQETRRKIEQDAASLTGNRRPSTWLFRDSLGLTSPVSRSRQYMLLFFMAEFSGTISPETDDAIFALFAEFVPQLKADARVRRMAKVLEQMDRTFFTFGFDDYDDLTLTTELISVRNLIKMNENDESEALALCHSRPTVLFHGELDFLTPVASAHAAYADSKCYPGEFHLVVLSGGGHEPLVDISEIIPSALSMNTLGAHDKNTLDLDALARADSRLKLLSRSGP